MEFIKVLIITWSILGFFLFTFMFGVNNILRLKKREIIGLSIVLGPIVWMIWILAFILVGLWLMIKIILIIWLDKLKLKISKNK